MQSIYPVLRYEDAPAAIDFLTKAFGFAAHLVVDGPDGTIAHAELRFGGNLVMLGSLVRRDDGGASLDAGPAFNYLVVEDPDEHHRRAVEHGAEIVRPLTDEEYGSREYSAKDPEGNLWSFGTYQPDHASPGAIPFIAYEGGVAAMDWLQAAFGFREVTRMMDGDRLTHGEMDTGSGLVMLAEPTPDYESPRRHREHCDAARRWLEVPWVVDGALVFVDDVDAHFERSRAAGAGILSEPEDGYPGRRYRAEDLEGHRWMFLQR